MTIGAEGSEWPYPQERAFRELVSFLGPALLRQAFSEAETAVQEGDRGITVPDDVHPPRFGLKITGDMIDFTIAHKGPFTLLVSQAAALLPPIQNA